MAHDCFKREIITFVDEGGGNPITSLGRNDRNMEKEHSANCQSALQTSKNTIWR